MSAAASSMVQKPPAKASTAMPQKVAAMPTGSENGCGRRSVAMPMIGCRIEAVSWKTSVMMPMWTKSSASGSLTSG